MQGGGAARWLVPWLLVAAAGQVAAFEAVRRVFLDTARGQQLDTAALAGHTIGEGRIGGVVDAVLGAMTLLSLVAATVGIVVVALMRGRVALAAAATLLIVGANLTTQLVKLLADRPDFGIDVARAAAGNSLPSGHTTFAASVVVALVFVLPPAVQGMAGLLGAGYAALAGVATVAAGWHRPSDAVAALLLVGAWAAVAALLLVLAARPGPTANAAAPGSAGPAGTFGSLTGLAGRSHRFALITLVLAGLVLLAAAVAALVVTDRALPAEPNWLSRRRLFAAYAGGAAGIAGVASVVMATVLATIHLVVPPRPAAR